MAESVSLALLQKHAHGSLPSRPQTNLVKQLSGGREVKTVTASRGFSDSLAPKFLSGLPSKYSDKGSAACQSG